MLSDVIGWPVGRVRKQHLHFIGMLRRAVDQQAVVLLWNRHRDMAFEVELVLSTCKHTASSPMRCRRKRRIGGRLYC